jgi:tetratricopeptide (TPR) repeat protein
MVNGLFARRHSTFNIQHPTLTILLFLLACTPHEPPKYNLLLITLDTFRADRITTNTPNLKKLTQESTTFENADSPVPLTLPAHCSLLSGVLPLHHGVRNNGANPFPPDRDDLATVLGRAGYRTGAFVSSFVLDRRFGLGRGFDLYDDEIPRDTAGEANVLEAERNGGVTVDRALAWLKQGDARPYFAWVHLYDAHAPYAPPSPYPPTYDGEIAYVDAQVGRLLAAVDRRNTIVAVVGDHGEALGEHGELTHGLLIYEPTLHVPMLISAPGAKARQVKTAVSTIDLAPTLAALVNAKIDRADGRALALDGEPESNDVYAETEYPLQFGWSDLASVRRGDAKLISNRELYDLARDPAEKVNRLAEQRREFRQLDDALASIRKTAVVAAQATVDEETRRKLASLGYIAPAPVKSGVERPDAVKMAPLFRRFEEATWALNGDRMKEAIPMLEQLVHDDPANPVFRESLARSLRHQGQLEPAIKLYREAVAISPGDAEAWYNLGVALEEAGHAEEGGIALREALRRDAKRPEAHNTLGIAFTSEGNLKAAEGEFREALAIDPRNARAFNNLGNTMRAMNRFDEAREAYRQAIAVAPAYADPLNGLGVIDVQQDRPREAIAEFDAALRIAPNHYEAQLNRGIALKLSGDGAAAADQFRRLLSALPPGREFDAQRKAARELLTAP